jgi:hypothetical protein
LRAVARAIGVITTIKIASYLLATLLLLLLHRLLFYGLLLRLLLHGFLLHGLHLKVVFLIPQLLKHVLKYSHQHLTSCRIIDLVRNGCSLDSYLFYFVAF